MKKVFFIIRLLIAAALVAALYFMCDPEAVLAHLKNTDPKLIIAALFVFLLSYVITAWRWQVVLKGAEKHIPFAKLIRYSFTASFCNNFLPTGFGGDITRVINMLPHGVSAAEGTGLLFLERLIGFLVIGLLIVITLPFVSKDVLRAWSEGDKTARTALVFIGAALFVLLLAMIFLILLIASKKAVLKFSEWFSKIPYKAVSNFLVEFLEKLNLNVRGAKTIIKLILVSTLLQFSFAIAFYLCFWAVLDQKFSFTLIFALVQTTSLLGVIPISIETIGTREFVFCLFLPIEVSTLLACLIIARAASVIMTLPGALFFITDGLFRKCTRSD